MEQRILDIIYKGDEVTWQSLIQDLVRVESMDPWNIDVSKLAQNYVEALRKMQQLDLRISGKMVLAAAILLKMKSVYLMERDMLNFDKLMHPEDYTEDALYEEQVPRPDVDLSKVRLIPKTPQPRKRKVSIYELVEALKLALEVKNKRRQILDSVQIKIPEKKVDISVIIEQLYENIDDLLNENERITFTQLIPSDKKEDKIGTFVPMLHLSNQQRIELYQQDHFGEIEITRPGLSKQHELDFMEEALKESIKQKKTTEKRLKTMRKNKRESLKAQEVKNADENREGTD